MLARLTRILLAAAAVYIVIGSPKQVLAQPGTVCSAPALTSALASATPGTIVRIGNCRIEGGGFVVPSGVRVEGRNVLQSHIAVPVGDVGFIVNGGAGNTGIAKLHIQSEGRAAITVAGAGNVVLDNLIIQPRRGVGIAGQALANVRVSDAIIDGPVTNASAAGIDPSSASRDSTALFGLLFASVSNLRVERVTINGFAQSGALIVNSTSNLERADFARNLGSGLTIYGGSATIERASGRGNLRGAGSQVAAFAFAGGAEIHTERLGAWNNEGYGVFHDHTGVVEHDRLTVIENDYTGVYANQSQYIQIDDLTAWSNTGAGVLALDTTLVSLDRADVRQTRGGTIGGVIMGDGIVMKQTLLDADRVTVIDSARAGILIDLPTTATVSDLSFDRVSVRGGVFGVIAQQGGLTLPLIRSGITRFGALARADAIFGTSGTPILLGAYTNPELIPIAQFVASSGIASIVGGGPIGGPGGDTGGGPFGGPGGDPLPPIE